MKYPFLIISMVLTGLFSGAQGKLAGTPNKNVLNARPKLVIGMVVDQMRWDYLYRFYDKFGEGGFKRLMKEGFRCENTFVPYTPTVTAAGHACIYTGSVPCIHGIVGNYWYDRSSGHSIYCTEDNSTRTIGGSDKANGQSPGNLWTTTICDELKLATNFKSKVIGVALKDRSGILPAGHSADAAYWFDTYSGHWVSSTYYMNKLPNWAIRFNHRNIADSLYKLNWETLYPLNTYTESDIDNSSAEGEYNHEQAPVFPHELVSLASSNYTTILATSYGNTMTLAFAKAAIENENLGEDTITDFLSISLSSTDYVGHQFGPNSIEEEDTYLRLDKELAAFLNWLDNKFGKGQYLFFLTADHAVAQVPGFLQEKKIPAKSVSSGMDKINNMLEMQYKVKELVVDSLNYQYYLNDKLIDSMGLDKNKVEKSIIDMLNESPDILIAFATKEIYKANLPLPVREMYINGYNEKRSGDIQVILKPGYIFGGKTGTTHGTWYPYDSHIPLIWMGWSVKKGITYETHYMTDIAVTLAALLKIQMPSGAIGNAIREVLK